jgi:hypothetical protein
MALVGGTITLRVNGRSFSTDAESTAKIQNHKNTAVPASDGIHYTQERQASTISGSLITTPDFNPDVVIGAENVTVMVEYNNGDVAVLEDAFFSGDATRTSKDGKLAFEFSGEGYYR